MAKTPTHQLEELSGRGGGGGRAESTEDLGNREMTEQRTTPHGPQMTHDMEGSSDYLPRNSVKSKLE